jgi:uncharacterized protein YjiS (DUF1127 family)
MAIALHHPLTYRRQPAAPAAPLRKRIRAWVGRMLTLWLERRRDLQAIELMAERDLRDIGATRYELRQELAKPFWRA